MWDTTVGRGQRPGAWAVALLVAGAGITVLPATASADVEPAGQRCFSVAGSVGDAAIVNVTPVRASGRGFGQLISSDVKSSPPDASNVNFDVGTVDPNVAVARIGADGEVCFQNSEQASVHLIADHLGTIAGSVYTSASPNGAPLRRVDTREGLGGSTVPPHGQLCFPVAGSPGDAAIVNLTPVRASGRGFGQLISSTVKANPPDASNANYDVRTVDPNVAVAQIGADGEVCFQNSDATSVDLIADHLGTVAGSVYVPATPSGAPVRRVDTRSGMGGARLEPRGRLCFSVTGDAGDAAVVNLTPVRASGRGFGQLVSSSVPVGDPAGSSVNFVARSVDPNVAVAQIGADGRVCFQNSAEASVDLIADHLGTFDGSVYTPASPDGAPERRVDTRYDNDDARPGCAAGSVPTGYDHETARTMFGLSSRAYEIEPGDATGNELHVSGDTATVHFEDQMTCWVLIAAIRADNVGGLGQITDTELIVARNDATNDLAVAFRGTELTNFWDILSDLDARRQPWTLPNGVTVQDAVHRGFATAYRAARPELLRILAAEQRAGAPGARVFFTGHSLGGAIASLASIDLVDDLMDYGYRRDEVVTYTFGAPRAMSRTMAAHHASFVPMSFAVANSMDPIPQVPTAIGADHYSHIPSMVMLNADLLAPEVRIDRGDGRNHRACVTSTPVTPKMAAANFALYHLRTEYVRRLSSTTFVGDPNVWITIAPKFTATAGRIQLNWSTPVEGPCDEAALYRTSGTPSNSSTPIRDRDVKLDTNDVHSTTVIKGDDYWIAYLNIFGEIVSKREYVPTTPRVSLLRRGNGIFPDTIDLAWDVDDPGAKDLVVLFDRDPRSAGPDGYYRSPVGRVESDPLVSPNPSPKATLVGSDPNTWWVAYIMEDGNGNRRILSVSQGVRG